MHSPTNLEIGLLFVQESHSAVGRKMLNDGFCDPCKTLLRGECESFGEHMGFQLFVHHKDAKSFDEAVQIQCPLCLRLWTAIGTPSVLHATAFNRPHRWSYNLSGDLYDMAFFKILESHQISGPGSVRMNLLSLEGKLFTIRKCHTVTIISNDFPFVWISTIFQHRIRTSASVS